MLFWRLAVRICSSYKFVVALAMVLALFAWTATNPQQYAADDRCNKVLQSGRWVRSLGREDSWQPESCVPIQHSGASINECMSPNPNSNFIFIGDSTARQIFWEAAHLMNPLINTDRNVHGNEHFLEFPNNITVHLLWDPYLNKSDSFANVRKISLSEQRAGKTNFVYATTGLWFALFEKNREDVLPNFQAAVDRLLNVALEARPEFGPIYFAPTQFLQYHMLDKKRKKYITPELVNAMNRYTDKIFNYDQQSEHQSPGSGVLYGDERRNKAPVAYYVPVYNEIGKNRVRYYDSIGLHYRRPAIRVQAQILLNHFCNSRISVPPSATCCVPERQFSSRIMFVSALWLITLMGLSLALNNSSTNSLWGLCTRLSVSIVVPVLYSQLLEQSPLFSKQSKLVSIPDLLIVLASIIVLSVSSITRVSTSVTHPPLKARKGIAIAVWLVLSVSALDSLYVAFAIAKRITEGLLLFMTAYEFASTAEDAVAGSFTFTEAAISRVTHLARWLAEFNLLAAGLCLAFNQSYSTAYQGLPAKISFWVTLYTIVMLPAPVLAKSHVFMAENAGKVVNAVRGVLLCIVLSAISGFAAVIVTTTSKDEFAFMYYLRSDWLLAPVAFLSVSMSPEVRAIIASPVSFVFALGGLVFISLQGAIYLPYQTVSDFSCTSLHIYVLLLAVCSSAIARPSHVSQFLRTMGDSWVPLLVLSQHIVLTRSGTARLALLGTGTTHNTLLYITSHSLLGSVLSWGVFLALGIALGCNVWTMDQNVRPTLTPTSSDASDYIGGSSGSIKSSSGINSSSSSITEINWSEIAEKELEA